MAFIKQAFIVVGHANFGKTSTMKALKGTFGVGKSKRFISDEQRKYWTKTVSNDDIQERLLTCLKIELERPHRNHIVIVLCPEFKDKNRVTVPILDLVKEKYGAELYFFVLKHKYHGTQIVTDEEIDKLKGYGTVEICEEKDADKRAKLLKKYIRANKKEG